MGRPSKLKKVCENPLATRFVPINGTKGVITLGIDEFEVIRLIDYLGLSQEEASIKMKVARTTIQLLYDIARKKIASFIVEAKELNLQGGNYFSCPKASYCFGKKMIKNTISEHNESKEYVCFREENAKLKLAVPSENNSVLQHFGKAQTFKLFTVENKQIKEEILLKTQEKRRGEIVDLLKENQIQVLICGNLEQGTSIVFKNAGICVYTGYEGNCQEAVLKLLHDDMKINENSSSCFHKKYEKCDFYKK